MVRPRLLWLRHHSVKKKSHNAASAAPLTIINSAAHLTAQSQTRMANPEPKKTVLFGAPDPLFSECLNAALSSIECKPHRPIRADAMLRELDHVEPDVVLLDDSYGEEQVAQLCHALKRRLPDLPIVVMTSDWLASEGARLRAAGVDHILRKPFGADRLVELLDSLPVQQKEASCSADA